MEKIDQTKITASTMKASSKISSTKVDSASTRPRKQKIYDPMKGRMVSVDPFGKRAKQLYRHYIELEGHDPVDILPPGLKYYPNSQMIKRLPKPKPRITERTAYKSYLSSFTLHNHKRVGGLAGFNLIHEMSPHLISALKHQALEKIALEKESFVTSFGYMSIVIESGERRDS